MPKYYSVSILSLENLFDSITQTSQLIILGFSTEFLPVTDVIIIGVNHRTTYLTTRLKQENKTFLIFEPPWSSKMDHIWEAEYEKFRTYHDIETGMDIEIGPLQDTGQIRGFKNTKINRQVFKDLGVNLTLHKDSFNAMTEWRARGQTVLNFARDNVDDKSQFPNATIEGQFIQSNSVGFPTAADFRTGEVRPAPSMESYKTEPKIYATILRLLLGLDKGLTWNCMKDVIKAASVKSEIWLKELNMWNGNYLRLAPFCDGLLHASKQLALFTFDHCSFFGGTLMPEIPSAYQHPLQEPSQNNNDILGGKADPEVATEYVLNPSSRSVLNTIRDNLGAYNEAPVQQLKSDHRGWARQIYLANDFVRVGLGNIVTRTSRMHRAKALVITEQPSARLLEFFRHKKNPYVEFDGNPEAEKDFEIFKKLKASWLYSELVEDNYLNPMTSFYNLANDTNDIPDTPGMFSISRAEVRNLRVVRYTGEYNPNHQKLGWNDERNELKSKGSEEIRTVFERLASKSTRYLKMREKDFNFRFKDVSLLTAPYMLTYSEEDAANDIALEFEALQGKHRVYWASPFFMGHELARQWTTIEKQIMPGLINL
jgi:hypothetical protein